MNFLAVLLKPLCLICEKLKKPETSGETENLLRDNLTGLYSLSYFDEKIDHEQARFLRYKSPFSVLILKIDDLDDSPPKKEKQKWEDTIKHIGGIVLSELRNVDVVARYKRTSFIMLLPHTKILHARFVGERLRAIIKDSPLKWEDIDYSYTVSLSVGEQLPEQSQEDLIKRINKKLTELIESGKDHLGIASDNTGDVPFEAE